MYNLNLPIYLSIAKKQQFYFSGNNPRPVKSSKQKEDIFQRMPTSSEMQSQNLEKRKIPSPHQVAIIGAGNSGYALLAALEQANKKIPKTIQPYLIIPRKTERSLSHLSSIEKTGDLLVEDTLQRETYRVPISKDQLIGSWDPVKMRSILENSQTLFVTLPDIPVARQSILKVLLKSDLEGKTIILSPGGEGGVLEAARMLSKRKGSGVTVGLLETSPFGSRMSPERLQTKWKRLVKVAAFPTKNTPQIIDTLNQLFPMTRATGERIIQFKAVHPVEIILSGQNYIYHVAVVLDAENLRRSIHTVQPNLSGEKRAPHQEKQDYNHYLEGVTPRIAEIMEKLDAERLAIGQAFGLELEPLNEALNNHYGIGRYTRYYDAFQACKNVYHSRVPSAQDLAHHRYVIEDLPGVSVIERLGAIANVPTPITSKLKEIATWNALAIGTEPQEIKGYHKALNRLPGTIKDLMIYFEDPAAWDKQTQDNGSQKPRPTVLKEFIIQSKL